jgi:hypothetical protein
MINPKSQIQNPKSHSRLWLSGDPAPLARLRRLVAAIDFEEPAPTYVYGRGRSAFYACDPDHVHQFQKLATALGLDLEELDAPADSPPTTTTGRWQTHSQARLLQYFADGRPFTALDAARVLHVVGQPYGLLYSMVETGQLTSKCTRRITHYRVKEPVEGHLPRRSALRDEEPGLACSQTRQCYNQQTATMGAVGMLVEESG